MSLSLAWVTPFGPASDIGAFSRNLLGEFHRVAASLDASVTLVVNENGPGYWCPLPMLRLTGTEADIELLLGFDVVVFNIGNNTRNHGHINRLALQLPGVVIVHDLVMHGALGAMLGFGDAGAQPRTDIYTALLGQYHGAFALETVAQSRICMPDAAALFTPWDSSAVADMPLIAPFVESAAALVVHSAHAEQAVRAPAETPVLRLALPWDQKPGLTEAEWEGWCRATQEARICAMVCIGHIGPTKCLDQVILAFAGSAELRERATLLIVGHPDDAAHLAQLQRMVAQYDLSGRIGFELSASLERLREIKLAADIFVNLRHPNTESASGSLAEQLDAGKPVVVYPTGAYGDVDAACVVRVDRLAGVAALAAALEALVVDPQARIRIGAAGRAHVRRVGRREYVAAFWDFLCAHQRLLRARASCATHRRAAPALAPTDIGADWLVTLHRARRPFAALSGSRLALDLAPFLHWEHDVLARHVAVGVFGREAGSPLEHALRAGLAKTGRADWAEAACLAHLVWRLANDAPQSATLLPAPVLHPRAWQLLAAIGRWEFVRCCHVGLLGRHATLAEILNRLTQPGDGSILDLVSHFLDSAEFAAGPAPPGAANALRDALATLDVPDAPWPLLLVDDEMRFTSTHPRGMDYLAPGWHEAEADGIWAKTSEAALLFRTDTQAAQRALVIIFRVIGGAGTERDVTMHVDGRVACTMRVPAMVWQTWELPITQGDQPGGATGQHDIRIDCGHTLVPHDIGLGQDWREIGIGLQSIRLVEAPAESVSRATATSAS